MADQNGIIYYETPIPDEGILFNADAFDSMTRSNGATLLHYKQIRCPLGMIDPLDDRHPHEEHATCDNGHIYKLAGEVTVQWTNSNTRNAHRDFGESMMGTVSITLPRFYDNCPDKDIVVAPYDRFYFKANVGFMENEEIIEAHRTGVDRLQFPAQEVIYLIDAHGIEYVQGDFSVENGRIRWLSNKRPQFDPSSNKGTVFSIRYKYNPFFYVKSLVHEVRLSTKLNPDGTLETQRMPYAVLLQREIIFESSKQNPGDTTNNNPRQSQAPRSSTLGPR